MYCPRCGHQSASGIHFCSRCGLALNQVGEMVAHDGLLPSRDGAPESAELSPRPGSQIGAKLMFLSAVLLPLCLSLGLFKRSLLPLIGHFWFDGPALLLIPAAVFFAGFVWMLYTRLFGDKTPAVQHKAGPARDRGALPSASTPAVQDTWFQPRRVSTAEMIDPPSVTDRTTRLFD